MKKVIIPTDWSLLNVNAVSKENLFDPRKPSIKKFYVIHYFDADCDECINNLNKISKFLNQQKQNYESLNFFFVGTGTTDLYLKKAVEKAKLRYPIFFEKNYFNFRKINKLPINQGNVYNTMLLNSNNELILFGSVFDNKIAQELYKDYLDCENQGNS